MPEDILVELYGYEFIYPLEERSISIHNIEELELQETENIYII